MMNRTFRVRLVTVVAFALLSITAPGAAGTRALQQQNAFRIAYTVAMSQPASHLFEVAIDVQTPAALNTIDFQIPKWQPGRYSVADFAKNVQEFSAKGGNQALPIRKVDDQTWRLETRGNQAVTVNYKVFGNDLSGTFAQLEATHGNFNGGVIVVEIAEHKQDPVEL